MKDDEIYRRKEESLRSSLIQDAVLRNLQTLTESTQRLSDTFKRSHPEVDWKAISGFRNTLVHNYLGTDVVQVWKAISEDLPGLEAAVRAG